VATKEQLAFLEVFETSRPANPLFCHQEFLEKLAEHGRDSIGRRTAFLMQRLSVDVRRLHYKTTHGINRGWRRSRLGGSHGSHFYAWWAPKNALPLKESGEFSDVPDGAVFLRDIRHHDNHSLLPPQSFETHYMPVTVRDLRREEYAPLPARNTHHCHGPSRRCGLLRPDNRCGWSRVTPVRARPPPCGTQRIRRAQNGSCM
jgi:hypothetical protein